MMDINELGSRFIKENKDTVNKNAFIFSKLVTKPITKGFLKKTFDSSSSDLDDARVIMDKLKGVGLTDRNKLTAALAILLEDES